MVNGATNTVLNSLTAELERLNRHATQVANIGNDPNSPDLAWPIVDVTLDSLAFKASYTVLKAEDENQHELLNIQA